MVFNVNEIYKIIIPEQEMYDLGYKTIGIDIFLDIPEETKLTVDFQVMNCVVRLKINNHIYEGFIENIDIYNKFYIILRNVEGVIWHQSDDFSF